MSSTRADRSARARWRSCCATRCLPCGAHAPLASRQDLHAIALYERLDGGSVSLPVDLPSPGEIPPTASLTDIVQMAWKSLRQATAQLPPPSRDAPDEEPLSLTLARTLSRRERRVCWLQQADHSGLGGYALFTQGQLVEQATEEGVYAEGDDYLRVPAEKWAAAMSVDVALLDFFIEAFPDDALPAVRDPRRPGRFRRFDPARYDVCID